MAANQSKQQKSAQQEQTERDRFSAYLVLEPKQGSGREKPYWLRVAPAFPHDDNAGYNIEIPQGMSLSGRVVIRKDLPRDQADHAGE